MAYTITINRPDAVALVEKAARKFSGGNKTEVVILAMRALLESSVRTGTLFGAHRHSIRVPPGVDLIAPALDVVPDAESGREIER